MLNGFLDDRGQAQGRHPSKPKADAPKADAPKAESACGGKDGCGSKKK